MGFQITQRSINPSRDLVCAGYDDPRRLVTLSGHRGRVNSVAWNLYGRQVATASDDNTAKTWDIASGKLLQDFRGHRGHVNSVAWSPDGRLIATASDDNTAKTWDVASGRLLQDFPGHTGKVISVSWNPDGRLIATVSCGNKIVKIWDVVSGKLLQDRLGNADYLISVSWNLDGRQIATVSWDKIKRMWTSATGEGIQRYIRSGWVNSIAWRPDGILLATALRDYTARIYDVASGELLQEFGDHTDQVVSIDWNSDGRQVATASLDKTAKTWDSASGKRLQNFRGHTGAVVLVSWSPDGKQLATASDDKTVKIWVADNQLEDAGQFAQLATALTRTAKMWTINEPLVCDDGRNIIFKLLKKTGGGVNSPGLAGSMPLHIASEFGDLVYVYGLLHRKADVNARDDSGKTPLHYATEYGHKEVMQALMQAKANRCIKDNDGFSYLDFIDYKYFKSHSPAKFVAWAEKFFENKSVERLRRETMAMEKAICEHVGARLIHLLYRFDPKFYNYFRENIISNFEKKTGITLENGQRLYEILDLPIPFNSWQACKVQRKWLRADAQQRDDQSMLWLLRQIWWAIDTPFQKQNYDAVCEGPETAHSLALYTKAAVSEERLTSLREKVSDRLEMIKEQEFRLRCQEQQSEQQLAPMSSTYCNIL